MRALIGMAVVAVAAPAPAQHPDWDTARTIEINLKSFAYIPATMTLQRGVPYRLHFVNQAGGGHNFVARDFFAEATIDPANRVALDQGQVELGGGDSATVRLISNRAGTYDVHCSHFLHSSFGMKGKIVVQ
jgi:plastocyanin